jgi:hypothetical protein
MKSPLDRGGIRFYLVLAALARGLATHTSILAGAPGIVLGTALHFWAKGCLRQNRVVAMIGPYRYVRHPFYLANALIDTSIAVMSGWWVLQALLPFWWLAVYLPVMRGEERHLIELFGPVYQDYQRRIPRLWPWRWPLPRGAEGFRWSNPNVPDEIPRALRILGLPVVFLVLADFRHSGAAVFASPLGLVSLVSVALIYCCAWLLKQRQASQPKGVSA